MNGSGLPEFPGPWSHSIFPTQVVHYPPFPPAAELWYILGFCFLALALVVGFALLIRAALWAIFGAMFGPVTGIALALLTEGVIIVVLPILEELGFRLLLLWFVFHGLLQTGLVTAFWWTLIAFLIAHVVVAVWDDWLRMVDAIIIGIINGYIFLYAVLVMGLSAQTAWAVAVMVHMAYNCIVLALKYTPGVGCLLHPLRMLALMFSILVYWAAMHLLRPAWDW